LTKQLFKQPLHLNLDKSAQTNSKNKPHPALAGRNFICFLCFDFC